VPQRRALLQTSEPQAGKRVDDCVAGARLALHADPGPASGSCGTGTGAVARTGKRSRDPTMRSRWPNGACLLCGE
jgi:hypothetical protein